MTKRNNHRGGAAVHSSVSGGEVDKNLQDTDYVDPGNILRNPDSFYGMLAEFFDSTGLSLILNARQTRLDLFLFYKEVVSRGGFRKINLEGKWSELVGAMGLEAEARNNEKPAIQLQRLYANLLFQFEQSILPRTAGRSSELPGLRIANVKRSSMKRSQDGESCPIAKKYEMSSNGVITMEQKSKSKNENKKDPRAPLGHRSPYQIFLKMECNRLRKLHRGTQESQNNTKKLALEAWRYLSNTDNRTDRERYSLEMKAYLGHLKVQAQETNIPPNDTVNVYNVTLNQEDAT